LAPWPGPLVLGFFYGVILEEHANLTYASCITTNRIIRRILGQGKKRVKRLLSSLSSLGDRKRWETWLDTDLAARASSPNRFRPGGREVANTQSIPTARSRGSHTDPCEGVTSCCIAFAGNAFRNMSIRRDTHERLSLDVERRVSALCGSRHQNKPCRRIHQPSRVRSASVAQTPARSWRGIVFWDEGKS